MSSLKFRLGCAAACAIALMSTSVRADSSALVTFSGLQAALFDLDPADGIDPSVALDQVERSGSAFQYTFPDASWPPLREDRVSGIGGAVLADANGHATAVLRDDSMEGEAVSTGSGAYTTLLTDRFLFTLTPHTRIIFSTLTQSAVVAERPQSAYAVITLAGQSGAIPGEFTSFESSNVRTGSGSSTVPIAVETSAGAVPLSGDIALRAFAYAAGVSPIPEPGRVAMLLAGLTLVAVASARRQWRHITSRLRRGGRLAAACALALGGAASTGLAQASSGSASIYDFAYELIDLAPDDGVAPSLIYTSDTVSGTVNANINNLLGGPWDETRSLSGYGREAVDIQASGAVVELSPVAARASAVAWGGAFSASGSFRFEFTLTPMTEVVFSAMAQARIRHDPAMRPDASEANIGLSGEIFNSPGQRTQFSSFIILNTPGDSARQLAVRASTGGLAGTGVISATAGTSAVGVSPIPEPATWLMLLAGLAAGSMLVPFRGRACGRPAGLVA